MRYRDGLGLGLGCKRELRWRRNNYARKLLTLLVSLASRCVAITRPSVITRSTRSLIFCFFVSTQLLHINYTLCDASLHTLIRTELSSSFHSLISIFHQYFFILLHLLGVIETLLQVVNTIFNWFNLILSLRYRSNASREFEQNVEKCWICAVDSSDVRRMRVRFYMFSFVEIN